MITLKFNKLAGVLLGAALMSSITPVSAIPSIGPSGMNFYNAPTIMTGDNGDLIWYRQAPVSVGADVQAWNVLYHSSDARGVPNVVTGTVLVPEAEWAGRGERPIISYAVATHGLDQSCAPSIKMSEGKDYESANIAAALNRGYAVLVTDNPGYTSGDSPTYLVGAAQAHAALDIVKAATQIPQSGVTESAKLSVWGFSQGGQTAAWAGELQPSYAPDLNLVAVAAGGVPADFPEIAGNLNGSTGMSFMLSAILGINQQYPEFPLEQLADSDGLAAIELGSSICVFEALFEFMNDRLSDFTVGAKDLDELLQLDEVYEPLVAQNLGSKPMPVPAYLYHGTADEFIPLDQHLTLKRKYCAKGGNITFGVYPSEHIVTQFQATPTVLDWLGDRFDAKPTIGSCITFARKPVANPNPGGGDFVVSLDKWLLDFSIGLKTLAQTVNLPKTATFSADANVTAQTLNGSLNVPSFYTKLNIILPLDVKLTVEAVEPTTANVKLDNDGILSLDGDAYASVKVNSAGFSFFQIPFGCKTSSSVEFPLTFVGPVSSLGNGNLYFSGTTSFPPLRGCGLFNGLFTALMSGPGQKYDMTVTPPAPKLY